MVIGVNLRDCFIQSGRKINLGYDRIRMVILLIINNCKGIHNLTNVRGNINDEITLSFVNRSFIYVCDF